MKKINTLIFQLCVIISFLCGIPKISFSGLLQKKGFSSSTHSFSVQKKIVGVQQKNIKSILIEFAAKADSQNVVNVPVSSISKSTKIASISSVIGANLLYYSNFKSIWWDNKPSGFYFVNDWYRNYALEQDKFSHFFAAQFISRQWAFFFESIGWHRRQALLLAAFSALLTGTGTEILDGFQPQYRFSIPDFIANVDGAFFPFFQEVFPSLRDLKIKLSYKASPFYRAGGINLFEDYDGMTFWWSYNFRKFMPADIKKFWPRFIRFALGYGVNQVWTGPDRGREFYVAIDFDFSYLPVKNRILKYLLSVIDQIHIGAPTLKFYPNIKTYYYFF